MELSAPPEVLITSANFLGYDYHFRHADRYQSVPISARYQSIISKIWKYSTMLLVTVIISTRADSYQHAEVFRA